MNRNDIARRKRFLVYDDSQFFPYVEKNFSLTKEQWGNLDRLDRMIANKLAHWFEFYVNRMITLDNTKEYSQLPAQFGLILCVTAVECLVGSPRGRSVSESLCELFKNHLTHEEITEFVQSINFVGQKPSLGRNCEFLANKRNGFMHRGELINLPQQELFAGLSHSDYRGRIRKGAIVNLSPNKLSYFLRNAIKHYLLTKLKDRVPKQNFSLMKGYKN
jgi:hypothetical protein